ncbi:MAG TPA: hypothetical protein VN704_08265 [Verrucomicrobiae bacterium]|nr:hypothetical protein [Verrucomicrobiae bacterium]
MSSSFTTKSHSSKDLQNLFTKLNFIEIREKRGIKFYQDPDSSIQTLQISDTLDMPYIEDKLNHIGLSYKVFRWLIK